MANCFSSLNKFEVKDAQARNSIATLTENVDTLISDNSTNKLDISNLKVENLNIKTSVENLQTKEETTKTDVENLKTANNEKTEQIENIVNYIDGLNEQVVSLQDKCDDKTNEQNKLNMIAHMGAVLEAPENSLKSYEIACQQKFYGIEGDVAITSDNKFVMMHDSTVDRMTTGSGEISSLTLAQIQGYTIDSGSNVSTYSGQVVPTLEQYLSVCKIHGARPIIELKDFIPVEQIENFYNVLVKTGFVDSCTVISFSKTLLEELRRLSSSIDIMMLIDMSEENIDYCVDHKFNISSSYLTISKTLVDYAHNHNVKVCAYTVNSQEVTQDLYNYGVDYITTNHINFVSGHDMPDYANILGLALKNEYEKEIYQTAKNYIGSDILGAFLVKQIGYPRTYPECYVNTATNRLISFDKLHIKSGSVINVSIPDGYKMAIHMVKSNLEVVDSGYITGNYTITESDVIFGHCYFAKVDDSNFTEVDKIKLRRAITSITY